MASVPRRPSFLLARAPRTTGSTRNVLGVDPSGSLSLGNQIGVVIRSGAHDNTIGTDSSAQKANVISGNAGSGVVVEPLGLDGGGGFGDSASGLVLNGSASMQGGRLRLTDGGNSEAGSAFLSAVAGYHAILDSIRVPA